MWCPGNQPSFWSKRHYSEKEQPHVAHIYIITLQITVTNALLPTNHGTKLHFAILPWRLSINRWRIEHKTVAVKIWLKQPTLRHEVSSTKFFIRLLFSQDYAFSSTEAIKPHSLWWPKCIDWYTVKQNAIQQHTAFDRNKAFLITFLQDQKSRMARMTRRTQ